MPNAIGLPAGTVVLTSNGYQNIEDIKVGDLVLTHKCRWRKVSEIITGQAEVGVFQGNAKIQMTPDVNIYSATESKHHHLDGNGNQRVQRELIDIGKMQVCCIYARDVFCYS